MGAKQSLVVGLTVIGLLVGANQALEPKTMRDHERQQQEQRWQELSDSQENEQERRRQRLGEDQDADRLDRMRPAERRPHPLPRLRLP